MEEKKEELSSQATKESSNNTNNSNTITHNNNRQTASFRHKGRILNLRDKINALAIKCYDEQLEHGWDYTKSMIRQYDKKCIIEAICHDSDSYTEDNCFWKSAVEKKHYHILFKCKNRKERKRVQALMNELGIHFRPTLDENLWLNHGVESISSFPGYSLYLTHDTDEAIRDGKTQYPLENVISNHSLEELMMIRDGYIRILNGNSKVTTNEMAEIDDQAFKLGYGLKDFSAWYDALPFCVRCNAKMKTVKESYQRGVEKRMAERKPVLRLCVFIKGKPNTGKTYASLEALQGKRIHTVEGGGTGKFDSLRADHEAIVISDDVCPNLLNIADNYICKVYKRQNNNPAWSGNYLVVTSNLSFEEWLDTCKISQKAHIDALKTRFYICEIVKKDDHNRLELSSPSSRGTPQELESKMNMFLDFQNKFNKSMASYSPKEESEDALKDEFNKWLTERALTMVRNHLPLDDLYTFYDYDWWKKNIYERV